MDPALDEAALAHLAAQHVLPDGERAHVAEHRLEHHEADRREVKAAEPGIEGEGPAERDAHPCRQQAAHHEQHERRVDDEDEVGEEGVQRGVIGPPPTRGRHSFPDRGRCRSRGGGNPILEPRIRIEHVERRALPAGLHDAAVLAAQQPRVRHAAGVRDHLDVVVHAHRVVGDAQVLLLDHQAALQPRVVRGDAGRAGVGVAAQRLDAAEREHEAARGVDEVGADAQRPRGARRGDELARRRRGGCAPCSPVSSSASRTRGSASCDAAGPCGR